MYEIIFIVVISAIVIAIFSYFAKKRSQAMEKAAIEMGFSFERKGKPFLGELDKNLHLLRQGRGKNLSNLMRGPNGVVLFDYSFQRAGLNVYSNRVTSQTVAAIHFPATAVPVFYLGPEHMWQKAASALGYHLIRFDSHPGFGKRFALRGSDEASTRQFFTPPLIEYCQSWPEMPAWCMEAAGPWLLLYIPNKQIKPANLHAFTDAAVSMFKEITNRAGVRVSA